MVAAEGNLLGGRFAQLGYVTNDMNRAIAAFRDSVGVKQFLRNDAVSFSVGKEQAARCNVALAVTGGIQVEIIQPLGGTDHVYRDSLKGGGFQLSLHHFCYWVDTVEQFNAVKADMRRAGYPIVIEGVDPVAQYFYADLRPVLGHYVEYVLFNPEAAAALMAAIPIN